MSAPARPPKATCASTASSTPPAATAPKPSIPATASSARTPTSPPPAKMPASSSSDLRPRRFARWDRRPPRARSPIAAGAPVVPGTDQRRHARTRHATSRAQHGYPVLLKAVAGGGGKGMRRVDREADLEARLARRLERSRARLRQRRSLRREADRARPPHRNPGARRSHGNMVHLGERECSIQRRHQKVIEECPSPLIARHPEMREAMGEAAVQDRARRRLLQRRHRRISGGPATAISTSWK